MSESTLSTGSIPLQQGLTTLDDAGDARLRASHCPQCDLVFFPQRKYCGKCGSTSQQEKLLSRTGSVFAFSQIDRKSQYTLVEPPYIQAEVAMPEGVHVFTVLEGCAPNAVRIGMPVEVFVDKVRRDAEGRDVMAYKFRPATA